MPWLERQSAGIILECSVRQGYEKPGFIRFAAGHWPIIACGGTHLASDHKPILFSRTGYRLTAERKGLL